MLVILLIVLPEGLPRQFVIHRRVVMYWLLLDAFLVTRPSAMWHDVGQQYTFILMEN